MNTPPPPIQRGKRLKPRVNEIIAMRFHQTYSFISSISKTFHFLIIADFPIKTSVHFNTADSVTKPSNCRMLRSSTTTTTTTTTKRETFWWFAWRINPFSMRFKTMECYTQGLTASEPKFRLLTSIYLIGYYIWLYDSPVSWFNIYETVQ